MENLSETPALTVLETPILRLRDVGFDWLTAQLKELGKKAVKLGMSPPTLTITHEEVVTERDLKEEYTQYNPVTGKYDWPTVNVRYRTVEVTGEIPKLGGWALVAVVEHTDSGNLLKKLPLVETELEERFKFTTTQLCDHCGVNRQRNQTFIVEDEFGIQMQVGRSCLKDFTGHQNPLALANLATLLSELLGKAMCGGDEEFGGGGRHEKVTDFQTLLGVATAVVRVDGGYRKANTPGATGGTVRELLYPTPLDRRSTAADREADRVWRTSYQVLAGDTVLASEACEWAKAQPETVTEYLWNVRVLAHEGWLHGFGNWGIACSVIQAYLRFQEKAQVKAAKPVLPASTYQGTVGGKLTVQRATVLRTQTIESDWGSSLLFVLQDEGGAVYNWFCSGKLPICPVASAKYNTPTTYGVDAMVNFTGTVKRHQEYREEQVTLLTRVKFN